MPQITAPTFQNQVSLTELPQSTLFRHESKLRPFHDTSVDFHEIRTTGERSEVSGGVEPRGAMSVRFGSLVRTGQGGPYRLVPPLVPPGLVGARLSPPERGTCRASTC
ncbi:Hypothetical protein NTJ_15802 [Nesidiocoris tenuis]|uniref:Uncharacterized protein n=1 Tax=Nesidiocoris tenuis TaxID=355587 RepID=A0ABN7BFC9_9HEMI|nr:Hypothetical protein NTJ_15802 [Nesidiocoris tenuis]